MLFRNPPCLSVVLVALLSVAPCFGDASKDMDGLIFIGSYRPKNITGRAITDEDSDSYYISQGSASWNEANADCKRRSDSKGSKTGLLWFSTLGELEHLADMLANRFPGPLGHWTSGIYSTSKGKWIWSTTKEDVQTWVPWKGGAPRNSTDSRNRLVLSVHNEVDFFIEIDTENASRRYICKRASVVVSEGNI